MYILKNAYKSITRNIGRNVLIGIIILVVSCAATVTLAINNTASDLIDSYESAYNKEITISFNRSAVMQNFDFRDKEGKENAKEVFNNMETYSIDDVKNFAESDYIEDYYYIYNIYLNGNNLEKAENDSQLDRPGGKMNNRESSNSMDFTLTGYSSIDSMSEFIDGSYSISEISDNAWDVAFDGNYVFINKELADYNNLSLNDKIVLEDSQGVTYEFIIIGIFSDNNEESDNMMSLFSNSANTIITNASALVNIDNSNDNIVGTVNPTFIINDYDDVDIIQEEFYEKGLSDTYIVSTNEEVATAGISSIQNVLSFSKTFLIITIIIGGVVLFVINMINIRERKYEIGVLRTIGISKFKLTLQFVCELSIVALIALTIGLTLGANLSKPVSNSLLSSEIENSQKETMEMRNNFGGKGNMDSVNGMDKMNKVNGVPSIQAYDKVNAVVNFKVVLELFVICLSLILVSSLSALISIQRFSPLTILKERS